MAMEMINKCILKAPSIPDLGPHPPHHHLHDGVSTVPLNIFDKVAGNVHFPVLMAYRKMPSNEALIDSLSKAIQPYPHLTGRISMDSCSKRPSFVLNNAGIGLVETKIPLGLADNTLLEDIPYHKNLYPPVTPDTEEVFQIQLNRYACGGLVLGFTFCHLVADGISIAQFIQSWARVSRGAGMGPAPFHDRHSLFVPNDPPQVKFDHLEVRSNGVSSLPRPSKGGVESIVIQFPGDFIARLKKQVPFRCTTFECLLAHLWRKTTQIRGIPEDEVTRVRVAVSGRTRLRPVVPPEYFGNLVAWALPKARAGELARGGLSGAVGIVRKAVARMDNEYFRSAIDFGAVLESREEEEEDSSGSLQMGDEEDWENMLYPDLEVDSWLGFRTNEIDFGQGPPCAIVPPSLPIEGVMAFISSAKGKGGVDAFLTIRKEHVHDFKRICMTLH